METMVYMDLFSGEAVKVKMPKEKGDILQRIHYRPSENIWTRCYNCGNRIYKFRGFKCEVIGISNSAASNVDTDHVCDQWKN